MITAAPVHVWLPAQAAPVAAGGFALDSNAGAGKFQYAQAYLRARGQRAR